MGDNILRAKFVVSRLEIFVGNINVELLPAITGSEENKTFSKYTPSGKIALTITNEQAYDFFKIGKEYYIDFTKAEDRIHNI